MVVLRSVGAALWVSAWLFAWGQMAAGQDLQEIVEMDLEELAQVEIATGISVPISEAPAVATVITAEEIAAMGATDLDQVLETGRAWLVADLSGREPGQGIDHHRP